MIGNLQLLSLHPHRSLHSLSRRHGPLLLLHFGRVPILIASSAEIAHEIMKTHDHKFANRPKSKAIDIIMNGGRDIIFGSNDEHWRQMKSMCVVHLLNTKVVRSFEYLREEELKLMIKKLDKASSSNSSVNLTKLLMNLTSDSLCRVTLGRKYDGDEGGMDIKNLMLAVSGFFGQFPIGEYIPSLAWIDWIRGFYDQMEDVNGRFDVFLEKVLQEHDENNVKFEEKKRLDLVDVLLSVQRDEKKRSQFDRTDLKLILKDIFFGGTATTSSTMEWIMTELIRHPKCMKKLRDEINSVSMGNNEYVKEAEVENMSYLKAVIKEGLRLHPSVPILGRFLSEDVKLLGYDILVGTQVIINNWAIQRDPMQWGADVEEFKPERHLDSGIDFQGQDFKYIPFGSGRRLCPGIKYSLVLVEVTLANLVKRFNWSVEVAAHDDKHHLSETTGLDNCRKFPLMAFPSIVQA